jgi:hypothetical protein
MTIAIMTIAGMFISGMLGMKKGDNVIVATNLAQSAMEQAKNATIVNFDLYNPTPVPTFPDMTIGGTIYKRKMYAYNTQYPPPIATPITQVKYIEISVYWDNKSIEGKTQNKPSEIKLSTSIKQTW